MPWQNRCEGITTDSRSRKCRHWQFFVTSSLRKMSCRTSSPLRSLTEHSLMATFFRKFCRLDFCLVVLVFSLVANSVPSICFGRTGIVIQVPGARNRIHDSKFVDSCVLRREREGRRATDSIQWQALQKNRVKSKGLLRHGGFLQRTLSAPFSMEEKYPLQIVDPSKRGTTLSIYAFQHPGDEESRRDLYFFPHSKRGRRDSGAFLRGMPTGASHSSEAEGGKPVSGGSEQRKKGTKIPRFFFQIFPFSGHGETQDEALDEVSPMTSSKDKKTSSASMPPVELPVWTKRPNGRPRLGESHVLEVASVPYDNHNVLVDLTDASPSIGQATNNYSLVENFRGDSNQGQNSVNTEFPPPRDNIKKTLAASPTEPSLRIAEKVAAPASGVIDSGIVGINGEKITDTTRKTSGDYGNFTVTKSHDALGRESAESEILDTLEQQLDEIPEDALFRLSPADGQSSEEETAPLKESVIRNSDVEDTESSEGLPEARKGEEATCMTVAWSGDDVTPESEPPSSTSETSQRQMLDLEKLGLGILLKGLAPSVPAMQQAEAAKSLLELVKADPVRFTEYLCLANKASAPHLGGPPRLAAETVERILRIIERPLASSRLWRILWFAGDEWEAMIVAQTAAVELLMAVFATNPSLTLKAFACVEGGLIRVMDLLRRCVGTTSEIIPHGSHTGKEDFDVKGRYRSSVGSVADGRDSLGGLTASLGQPNGMPRKFYTQTGVSQSPLPLHAVSQLGAGDSSIQRGSDNAHSMEGLKMRAPASLTTSPASLSTGVMLNEKKAKISTSKLFHQEQQFGLRRQMMHRSNIDDMFHRELAAVKADPSRSAVLKTASADPLRKRRKDGSLGADANLLHGVAGSCMSSDNSVRENSNSRGDDDTDGTSQSSLSAVAAVHNAMRKIQVPESNLTARRQGACQYLLKNIMKWSLNESDSRKEELMYRKQSNGAAQTSFQNLSRVSEPDDNMDRRAESKSKSSSEDGLDKIEEKCGTNKSSRPSEERQLPGQNMEALNLPEEGRDQVKEHSSPWPWRWSFVRLLMSKKLPTSLSISSNLFDASLSSSTSTTERETFFKGKQNGFDDPAGDKSTGRRWRVNQAAEGRHAGEVAMADMARCSGRRSDVSEDKLRDRSIRRKESRLQRLIWIPQYIVTPSDEKTKSQSVSSFRNTTYSIKQYFSASNDQSALTSVGWPYEDIGADSHDAIVGPLRVSLLAVLGNRTIPVSYTERECMAGQGEVVDRGRQAVDEPSRVAATEHTSHGFKEPSAERSSAPELNDLGSKSQAGAHMTADTAVGNASLRILDKEPDFKESSVTTNQQDVTLRELKNFVKPSLNGRDIEHRSKVDAKASITGSQPSHRESSSSGSKNTETTNSGSLNSTVLHTQKARKTIANDEVSYRISHVSDSASDFPGMPPAPLSESSDSEWLEQWFNTTWPIRHSKSALDSTGVPQGHWYLVAFQLEEDEESHEHQHGGEQVEGANEESTVVPQKEARDYSVVDESSLILSLSHPDSASNFFVSERHSAESSKNERGGSPLVDFVEQERVDETERKPIIKGKAELHHRSQLSSAFEQVSGKCFRSEDGCPHNMTASSHFKEEEAVLISRSSQTNADTERLRNNGPEINNNLSGRRPSDVAITRPNLQTSIDSEYDPGKPRKSPSITVDRTRGDQRDSSRSSGLTYSPPQVGKSSFTSGTSQVREVVPHAVNHKSAEKSAESTKLDGIIKESSPMVRTSNNSSESRNSILDASNRDVATGDQGIPDFEQKEKEADAEKGGKKLFLNGNAVHKESSTGSFTETSAHRHKIQNPHQHLENRLNEAPDFRISLWPSGGVSSTIDSGSALRTYSADSGPSDDFDCLRHQRNSIGVFHERESERPRQLKLRFVTAIPCPTPKSLAPSSRSLRSSSAGSSITVPGAFSVIPAALESEPRSPSPSLTQSVSRSQLLSNAEESSALSFQALLLESGLAAIRSALLNSREQLEQLLVQEAGEFSRDDESSRRIARHTDYTSETLQDDKTGIDMESVSKAASCLGQFASLSARPSNNTPYSSSPKVTAASCWSTRWKKWLQAGVSPASIGKHSSSGGIEEELTSDTMKISPAGDRRWVRIGEDPFPSATGDEGLPSPFSRKASEKSSSRRGKFESMGDEVLLVARRQNEWREVLTVQLDALLWLLRILGTFPTKTLKELSRDNGFFAHEVLRVVRISLTSLPSLSRSMQESGWFLKRPSSSSFSSSMEDMSLAMPSLMIKKLFLVSRWFSKKLDYTFHPKRRIELDHHRSDEFDREEMRNNIGIDECSNEAGIKNLDGAVNGDQFGHPQNFWRKNDILNRLDRLPMKEERKIQLGKMIRNVEQHDRELQQLQRRVELVALEVLFLASMHSDSFIRLLQCGEDFRIVEEEGKTNRLVDEDFRGGGHGVQYRMKRGGIEGAMQHNGNGAGKSTSEQRDGEGSGRIASRLPSKGSGEHLGRRQSRGIQGGTSRNRNKSMQEARESWTGTGIGKRLAFLASSILSSLSPQSDCLGMDKMEKRKAPTFESGKASYAQVERGGESTYTPIPPSSAVTRVPPRHRRLDSRPLSVSRVLRKVQDRCRADMEEEKMKASLGSPEVFPPGSKTVDDDPAAQSTQAHTPPEAMDLNTHSIQSGTVGGEGADDNHAFNSALRQSPPCASLSLTPQNCASLASPAFNSALKSMPPSSSTSMISLSDTSPSSLPETFISRSDAATKQNSTNQSSANQSSTNQASTDQAGLGNTSHAAPLLYHDHHPTDDVKPHGGDPAQRSSQATPNNLNASEKVLLSTESDNSSSSLADPGSSPPSPGLSNLSVSEISSNIASGEIPDHIPVESIKLPLSNSDEQNHGGKTAPPHSVNVPLSDVTSIDGRQPISSASLPSQSLPTQETSSLAQTSSPVLPQISSPALPQISSSSLAQTSSSSPNASNHWPPQSLPTETLPDANLSPRCGSFSAASSHSVSLPKSTSDPERATASLSASPSAISSRSGAASSPSPSLGPHSPSSFPSPPSLLPSVSSPLSSSSSIQTTDNALPLPSFSQPKVSLSCPPNLPRDSLKNSKGGLLSSRRFSVASKLLGALGLNNDWRKRLPGQRGIRILSIDGGGTRGVMSIALLKHIAAAAGRDLHEVFDIICGTSTGGIIAVLVGVGKANLNEVERMYDSFIKTIFARDAAPIAGARLVVQQAYYDASVWEKILKEGLNETRMIDAAADPKAPKVFCLSTMVSSNPSQLVLWRNYSYSSSSPQSRYSGSFRIRMRDALRATTAAPGFFPTLRLDGQSYGDGALLANNPTAVALAEARVLYPGVPIEAVVSIGTGRFPSETFETRFFGWDGVVTQLINSATNTEGTHELLSDFMPRGKYFRFNPEIEVLSIDETRPEKLEKMKNAADLFFKSAKNRRELAMLGNLLKPKENPTPASSPSILEPDSRRDRRARSPVSKAEAGNMLANENNLHIPRTKKAARNSIHCRHEKESLLNGYGDEDDEDARFDTHDSIDFEEDRSTYQNFGGSDHGTSDLRDDSVEGLNDYSVWNRNDPNLRRSFLDFVRSGKKPSKQRRWDPLGVQFPEPLTFLEASTAKRR